MLAMIAFPIGAWRHTGHCLWRKPKSYIGTQLKCTKQWKQRSAIKQLLKTLLLVIKMCTGFTTDVIWMNIKVCSITSEQSQGSSRRVLPYRLISATEHLRGELHKSEALVIAGILYVKKITFVTFTSQMFSSAYECLKGITHLLLLWDDSLVRLHFFVFIHITSVVKPAHIFMARSKVFKSCLVAELCFDVVHFSCVPIYTFGFRHKHCARD